MVKQMIIGKTNSNLVANGSIAPEEFKLKLMVSRFIIGRVKK